MESAETKDKAMDAPASTAKSIRASVNRFLPYWAVFQADLRQTLANWIYRLWVLLTLATAGGYLLYRYGAKEVAGIVTPAPELISQLLKWIVHGSITLIVILTAGTICGERGTMADSILSRGISRHQYFLGKWHARLTAVLVTFFLLGLAALVASFFLLHGETLHLGGSLMALATVAAMLAVVITCGVTASAVANSSVVSISVVWLLLYGGGFALSLLPASFPAPDRILQNLPNILRGHYDVQVIGRVIAWSLAASLAVALFGMISFSRRDV